MSCSELIPMYPHSSCSVIRPPGALPPMGLLTGFEQVQLNLTKAKQFRYGARSEIFAARSLCLSHCKARYGAMMYFQCFIRQFGENWMPGVLTRGILRVYNLGRNQKDRRRANMMNRVDSMIVTQSRPVCAADMMSYYAFMNAACYFSVLRFYFTFYFYLHAALSERKRIS